MTKAAKAPTSPVTIIGQGRVKASGQPVYAATSASTPGRVYLIAWTPNGWSVDVLSVNSGARPAPMCAR